MVFFKEFIFCIFFLGSSEGKREKNGKEREENYVRNKEKNVKEERKIIILF